METELYRILLYSRVNNELLESRTSNSIDMNALEATKIAGGWLNGYVHIKGLSAAQLRVEIIVYEEERYRYVVGMEKPPWSRVVVPCVRLADKVVSFKKFIESLEVVALLHHEQVMQDLSAKRPLRRCAVLKPIDALADEKKPIGHSGK